MIRLLEDDDLRVRIAATGAADVRRFTWEASGDAFVTATAAALSMPWAVS